MDLSAKAFVQAVSPSSAHAIDLDELDAHLGFDDDDEEDNEGDDGEAKEVLEAEVDAADSIGKALLLVKKVCDGCYNLHHHSHVTSDSCFSSGSGFFHEVLPAG